MFIFTYFRLILRLFDKYPISRQRIRIDNKEKISLLSFAKINLYKLNKKKRTLKFF
jgi:hypothetical protein